MVDSGRITRGHSGAANIYDNLLSAYRFLRDSSYTTGDTLYRVVAKWEPDYEHSTEIAMGYGQTVDTIYISGDTVGDYSWHDEWDDWSSLHEYGHHVMNRCAKPYPPYTPGEHFWYLEYPNPRDKGLAYAEGWANFFAAGVSDSIYQVNTIKGIGRTTANDTTYYHNVENPWDGSHFISSEFEGGPWCEGAVAGVLWDIYDSNNEYPYPYYPSGGFTDTTSDLMTQMYRQVWNVFDHYKPPDTTSCQTIFEFRSGWYYYAYLHGDTLNQITYHHYIADSVSAKPTGLFDSLIYIDVYLRWDNNDEADLDGYRIIRRGKIIFGVTDWSNWAFIGDNTDPNDTTFIDTTVLSMWYYQYKVTAYDTMGCESEPSDSVQVSIPQSCPVKSPMRVETPIISCISNLKLSVPEGSKEIAISIYDCCGRVVGNYNIRVKKEDNCKIKLHNVNDQLPSGVYFVHLETDKKQSIMGKIIIVR